MNSIWNVAKSRGACSATSKGAAILTLSKTGQTGSSIRRQRLDRYAFASWACGASGHHVLFMHVPSAISIAIIGESAAMTSGRCSYCAQTHLTAHVTCVMCPFAGQFKAMWRYGDRGAAKPCFSASRAVATNYIAYNAQAWGRWHGKCVDSRHATASSQTVRSSVARSGGQIAVSLLKRPCQGVENR